MAVLAGAWFGLAYLTSGGSRGLMVAIAVALAPAALALLVVDLRDARRFDASSRLCVAVVASLTVVMVFAQGNEAVMFAAQSFFALVVAVLFARAHVERRRQWLKVAGPLCLLGALFGLTLVMSYVASGVSSLGEAANLASLLLASAFFVMPVLTIGNLSRFEWLLAILLVMGAGQVAVVTAQAAGLTAGLPGRLSVLDSAAIWSVSPYASDPIRHIGTFGSFELLAEYATLVTLLGVGLSIISGRRSLRVLGVLCAICAAVTGFFTGTRGYLVAVAIGLGVLLLLLPARVRGKGALLARLAAVAAVVSAIVYAVVPEGVLERMVGRLATLELTGPNAFNRGLLFDVWMRLAMRMPLLGYGARMLDTIRAEFPGFVMASPHSLYFWVLLTAGIFGLVLFVILIGMLLAAQVRIYRADAVPSRAWSAVFIAVLVAWLANEYKIDCVRSPLYVDWLMFVLGMPLALSAASSVCVEEIESASTQGQLRRHARR